MLSDKGIRFLSRLEGGMHLRVYDDGSGYPTIGLGHLCSSFDVHPDGITEEEGWALFRQDAKWVVQAIRAVHPQWKQLEQHQYDALFCFIYNIGATQFDTSLSRDWLSRGRYNYVPVGFFEFTKSNGYRLKGLLNRRVKEFTLWHWGDYDEP